MDFETTSFSGSQLFQQLKSTLAQYAPDYAEEARQYEQAKDSLPDSTYSDAYVPKNHMFYTVLVDCRLRDSEKLVGRKNYTLAHEIAHQVLYKAFPNAYHSANRLTCDYRRTRNSHKKISNWVEWQADALAAALLMPKDAILDVMFLTGLGEHIGTLNKKYTPNKYESFCRLAETLGASKSALSFRMEQLGLLDRNLL